MKKKEKNAVRIIRVFRIFALSCKPQYHHFSTHIIPKKLYNGQTLANNAPCRPSVSLVLHLRGDRLLVSDTVVPLPPTHKRQCTTQQLLQQPRGHTPPTPWCNKYSNSMRPSRTTTTTLRHKTHRTHRTHRHRHRARQPQTPRQNGCPRHRRRPTRRQKRTLVLGDWAEPLDEAPRDVSD